MNFLKQMFGASQPSEQQKLSNKYAEFLTFQLSCRYFDYNQTSGSKICQCIDGTASFDVKLQSEGVKEFSILIKNNLHDDDQENANLMLFPLNASVSIKRYKYDMNDGEGIQQGFALQYTAKQNLKFLIEFHSTVIQAKVDEFHDKVCRLMFQQLQGNEPQESDRMSYQQLVLQGDKQNQSFRFSDYYNDVISPSAFSPSFGGNDIQEQPFQQHYQHEEMEEEKFSQNEKPKFNKPSGISLSIEENQPKFPSFPTLFSGAGSLYLFDRSNNTNVLAQNSVVFTVLQRTDFSDKKNPKYCYGIGVFDGDESLTIADFNQDTHLSLSPYQNSLFWVSYDLVTDVINSWVFRFQNQGVIFKLKGVFAKCNLQLQRQQEYEKAVKQEDRDWIENTYCNMRDIDSLEPDEQMQIEDMQFDQDVQDAEDDDQKNVPGGLKFIKPYQNQEPNKHRETIQAGSYNRTFTVRGKDVSVYRNGGSKGAVQADQDGLQHVNTFNSIFKKECDDYVVPRQMMFHGNQKQMIFLDQNEKNKMFCMDLETAKVVDEWKAGKDQNNIVQMSNAYKNAQLDNIDEFVGIGKNVVQKYDPRKNTQQKMCEERSYKVNPKFTCIVTTKTGELATGSETGEIKLYSKVGQIAKTALPGLGDPIRHIDSTQDGLWVLATCDKYLLVIPTYMQNTSKSNYGDSNGFKMRMGKDKPSPLKLTIKPRDIAYYGIKTVKFTGAKFNSSKEMGRETSISTSTGEFLITWSFSKVQKGILQDYKIKPMRDSVCENQFRFGTDQSIVVTFPEKLQMQKRRKA